MVSPVTDPTLLAELNGDPQPVTDPALLAELNGAAPVPAKSLEQVLGPSDFTKAFASTPARMLKSAMQMVGAGDYVPEAVSNVASQGGASTLGRIAGDVAGTGGIKAGAGALSQALQSLNAAKGVVPAVARTAEAATYGGAQGAITSPDDQANAAKWGAGGGVIGRSIIPIAQGVGNLAAHTLGTTTGAGAESVKQAFKGGPEFVANMRGKVPPEVVVEQARAGVQSMRQQMHEAYRANKEVWAAGQQPLDFRPVGRALVEVSDSLNHQGMSRIGPSERKVLDEARDVLTNFATNRQWHTAEGFDALKQRLQAIYPESPQMGQAQRVITKLTSAVRDAITQQNPAYANAMKDYWQRSSQLDEIERSLSLGGTATIDTTLRKLQSLMRPSAGQRLQSASTLAEQGGADVLPAMAGQAMSSWTPRGLQALGATGVGGYGVANPASLAVLPAMSPRLVGETANAAGKLPIELVLQALRRSAAPAALAISHGSHDDQP